MYIPPPHPNTPPLLNIHPTNYPFPQTHITPHLHPYTPLSPTFILQWQMDIVSKQSNHHRTGCSQSNGSAQTEDVTFIGCNECNDVTNDGHFMSDFYGCLCASTTVAPLNSSSHPVMDTFIRRSWWSTILLISRNHEAEFRSGTCFMAEIRPHLPTVANNALLQFCLIAFTTRQGRGGGWTIALWSLLISDEEENYSRR